MHYVRSEISRYYCKINIYNSNIIFTPNRIIHMCLAIFIKHVNSVYMKLMERKCITLSKDNCQHPHITEQNQTDINKSWRINLLEFSLYLKFLIKCKYNYKKCSSTIISEIYHKSRYNKCNYGRIA